MHVSSATGHNFAYVSFKQLTGTISSSKIQIKSECDQRWISGKSTCTKIVAAAQLYKKLMLSESLNVIIWSGILSQMSQFGILNLGLK